MHIPQNAQSGVSNVMFIEKAHTLLQEQQYLGAGDIQ